MPNAEPVSSRQVEREWSDIAFALKFYGALLGVQIITAVTAAGATGIVPLIVADLTLAVAGGVAVSFRWSLVRDSLLPRFPWRLALLIVAASLPIYVGVHLVVSGLSHAFSVPNEGYLADFRGLHLGWAYLIIAVNAGVLEELAFRGIIFTILRKYIRLPEALIVTSFAFAILHFSVLGLVTHVALGAYFCWLRERSGSVYPGMVAHILHNALVLLDEQFQVLPLGLS